MSEQGILLGRKRGQYTKNTQQSRYVCNKQHSFKMQEAKTNRTKRKNTQIHNYT